MDKKNSEKIILDLCGGMGSWSKPYKDAGYDVRNITLPDYDIINWEMKFDEQWTEVKMRIGRGEIYGILAAPPCTMFSFARTNAKKMRDFRGAMDIVYSCLSIIWTCQYEPISNYAKYTRLKFWALENPYRGLLKSFLGEPCYIFNPWEFGDMYKKETGLWGNFNYPQKIFGSQQIKGNKMKKFEMLLVPELEKLKSMTGRKKEQMKDDSWKDTKTRQAMRSITPAGFAKAFFLQNQ